MVCVNARVVAMLEAVPVPWPMVAIRREVFALNSKKNIDAAGLWLIFTLSHRNVGIGSRCGWGIDHRD